MFLQRATRTADGSTGAHASHEDVDAAFGVGPDFLTRGALVSSRVGRVHKLAEDDGTGCLLL